ncbi:Uncharacterized iron-regulated membrane protein [bacterium A37T11]|nr:Uncharacterized iron-regulated membrane protein [bacterium A37T11]
MSLQPTVSGKNNKKQFYWQLHHWVGLYTGILIGLLSLTGAMAVFIPEIDALVQRHHYKASSTLLPGELPRINRAVNSLLVKYPKQRGLSIILPDNPENAVIIELNTPQNKGKTQRYEFFVDAGSDRVVAHRPWQSSFVNYLRQMHVRLFEGKWGRQLVGFGGVGLTLVSITGLIIYGNFMKKQRWPNIRKATDIRIKMADWHKIFGIGALGFNLVIALTGAWLGLQPWLQKWLDIYAPGKNKTHIIMAPKKDRAINIDWTSALQAARKAFPELKPRHLIPSSNGAGTITFRGNLPGVIYERDINMLVLSKLDYKPLYKYDIREQPTADKFYYIQEALHFGDYGGLMVKVLYTILGLTSAFLSISGFVIFLFRRKKKQRLVGNPWKAIVFYTFLSLLFLVTIAIISMNTSYSLASKISGVVINGVLIGVGCYLLIMTLKKVREKRKLI